MGNEIKSQVDAEQNIGDEVVDRETVQGFTPGPWVVGGTWRNSIDDKSKGETTVIYAECVPLARTIWILNSGEYARSQSEAAANARLIAAAPALYKALCDLGGYTAALEMMINKEPEGEQLAAARAALALVNEPAS